MRVFLDFEASSLADHGYPVEVAWVWEDGRGEAHLLRPAPGWTDWDPRSEAIHGIARATLEAEGEPVEAIAARMVAELSGHHLFASAPSWDGKWLSALLRAGGQPRHALRLRDTDEAMAAELDPATAAQVVADIKRRFDAPPAHRALADAQGERDRWLAARGYRAQP